MTENFEIRTTNMPSEMQILLNKYPRDVWSAHPGFKEKTRHWLGAHNMFRRLGKTVRVDAESYLDKSLDQQDYIDRLAYYGNALVGNLHGHHSWEDFKYFPELLRADDRFGMGLDILEKDHEELNKVLDVFTESANRAIKLFELDRRQVGDEVAKVLETGMAIEAFLARHLNDEEELAVPIILHHRLRG